MHFRLGKSIARAAVLLVVAGGVVIGTESAALAWPTGCSSGIGFSIQYYGWALCTGGTGYYQVSVGCKDGFGSPYYATGPVKKVGQGRSRLACAGGKKPTATAYISWV
jgi:hypothetical protein